MSQNGHMYTCVVTPAWLVGVHDELAGSRGVPGWGTRWVPGRGNTGTPSRLKAEA